MTNCPRCQATLVTSDSKIHSPDTFVCPECPKIQMTNLSLSPQHWCYWQLGNNIFISYELRTDKYLIFNYNLPNNQYLIYPNCSNKTYISNIIKLSNSQPLYLLSNIELNDLIDTHLIFS
jgi:hypothetical protein